MTLWLVLGGMACGVVALLIGPGFLRRADPPSGRHGYDVAVYKDQLNEVDRDVERGHISADEAGTVRLEIQRRLLSAVDAHDAVGSSVMGASPFVIILALLIPVFSVVLYLQLGSPGTPDFPYAERDDLTRVAEGAPDISDMVAGLEARLATSPDDPEGWAMLGRSYLVLERYGEAATAYKKLYDLTGNVRANSEYAEAMILANDTIVNAEIIEVLGQVLREDPFDPKARFYFGVGAAQQGNLAGAVQIWTDLVHLSPSDASWLPTVRTQIDEAAEAAGIEPDSIVPAPEIIQLAISAGIDHSIPAQPSGSNPGSPLGPTAEDIENAASMSAEDQLSMIRSMVQRLADKLQENPDDPEGWARLIQAYEVLGETDKAGLARLAAEPYLP